MKINKKKNSWSYDANSNIFISVKWRNGKKQVKKISEKELIKKISSIELEDDLLDEYFKKGVRKSCKKTFGE